MVKADAKHDYYADLDLLPTADAEEIKKQFRLLAKQFHPDRNPGREIDVVAKFQAVQAAHEILCDQQLKTKYDADRAKLQNRANSASSNPPDTDPYNFRRPAPRPAPSGSSFPPPPRRTNTTQPSKNPFPNSNEQTTNGRPTAGAAKFSAFTQAAPQQWDRAKFDEAQRADAARGFQSMKNSQRMPPPQQPPTQPPRHPTARKPFEDAHSGDEGLRPGFPGMSRTANIRRQGFDPTSPNPGNDEPPAPRASAYATYNRTDRTDRPPASSARQGYFPEGFTPQSPPMAKQRPAVSPLRHARSSGFDAPRPTGFDPPRSSGFDAPPPSRPGLERVSSKYAMNGGERTNVSGGGLGRSASVRTSPVERQWDDSDGRFHSTRPHSHFGPSAGRHQSASPKLRPHHKPRVEYSSSSSGSSGEEFGPNVANRPKAQPRQRARPRVNTTNSERYTPRTEDPALTGQFPNNNYTKIVDDESSGYYKYPPPADGPIRRPFANMTVPENSTTQGMNGGNRNYDPGNSNHRVPPEQIHSSHNTNNTHSVSQENINTTFSADDWARKFDSGDMYFQPQPPTTTTDAQSRERKSPSKTSRTRTRSVGKGKNELNGQQQDGSVPVDGANGHTVPENVGSEEETFEDAPEQSKASAFQPAKFSADEWAEKLKDQTWSVPSQDLNARKTPIKRGSKSNGRKPLPIKVPPEDVMDIDENMTDVPPHVATNGANTAHQTEAAPNTGEGTTGGVSLDDLKNIAPFAPSNTGLKDLHDLSTTLPFESRAAPQVGLDRTKSSTARRLALPIPPKPVQPPFGEHLTQEMWARYVQDVTAYLHDWSHFNTKMIHHFHSRQDQINSDMGLHWVSSVGDGPTRDAFEAGNGNGPPAGFTTYMTWLEEDAECRTWWDVANEKHRTMFEEVAKVREKVKRVLGVS